MSEINCPYCEKDQDVDHDDGYGYSENEIHQQQCRFCDNSFAYTTSISYHYEPKKADCLNNSEHDWKPTITYPKEFTLMACSMCGDRRKLTEEEKNEFNIYSSENE